MTQHLVIQLKRLAVATVIALVLDLLWIGIVANSFYKSALGDLARTKPDGTFAPLLLPALLVYLLIPMGLTLFAIPRVLEGSENLITGAAQWGAPFGIVLYGVYELTNYSILKNYRLSMVLVDWLWGTVLCFGVTLGTSIVAVRFLDDRGAPLMEYDTIVSKVSYMSIDKPADEEAACPAHPVDDEPVFGSSSWPVGGAHIVTVCIGAGVLAIPQAVAYWGWVGGMMLLVFFSVVMYVVSHLLTYAIKHEDQRFRSYTSAVLHICGHNHALGVATIQYTYMAAATVAYTITAALSLQRVQQLLNHGHSNAPWVWVVPTAIANAILSLAPNLESSWIGSVVASAMALLYSAIVIYLGIANWQSAGTVEGVVNISTVDKVFGMAASLGTVMFAFAYSLVLIEISATIKEPVQTNMRKAVRVCASIFALFYTTVGFTSYAALGNAAAGNGDVLLSYSQPAWLLVLANIAVFIHMLPAFQVFAQANYAAIETAFGKTRYSLQIKSPVQRFAIRAFYRFVYVALASLIAGLIPFFTAVVGLLGAFQFWPLSVYWPVKMYFVTQKPSQRWVRWSLLGMAVVTFVATIVAFVGSVYWLVQSVHLFSIGGQAT